MRIPLPITASPSCYRILPCDLRSRFHYLCGCVEKVSALRFLLHQDPEAILERGTNAVPEEGAATAFHSQPGGSRPPDRWRPHAVPAHSAHDSVRHRLS